MGANMAATLLRVLGIISLILVNVMVFRFWKLPNAQIGTLALYELDYPMLFDAKSVFILKNAVELRVKPFAA